MARPFVHHLATHFPGDLRQLALRPQFGKLRFVICIGNRAGPQAVSEAEADIVSAHNFANLTEARVEKAFLVMGQAPFSHDRTTTRDDAGDAVGGERDVAQQHAGMDSEIIHALLALLD